MINNRQQNGRRRGRGGQGGQGGQGSQGGQRQGRPDLGNRIDNRARGNAAQLLEKYKTLARDAQQSGDRVLAEYYLQFADHYFRVLAETRARFEEANPNAHNPNRRPLNFGEDSEDFDAAEAGDSDGEDDEPRAAQPQPQRQYRDDRPQREDRPQRDSYQREDRPQQAREDRPQRDAYQREDRPREDRPREDRPREDRQQQPREDRPQREARPPREDRPQREDRPRRDDRPQRTERPVANGNAVAHDDTHDDGGHDTPLPFDALPPAIGPLIAMEPVAGVEGEPIAAPRKRGRPRKVVDTPVEG